MLSHYFLCFCCCCSLEMQFFCTFSLTNLKFISCFSPKELFLNLKKMSKLSLFYFKKEPLSIPLWTKGKSSRFGFSPLTFLSKEKERNARYWRGLEWTYFKFYFSNICTLWNSIKDNRLACSLLFSPWNCGFCSLRFCA